MHLLYFLYLCKDDNYIYIHTYVCVCVCVNVYIYIHTYTYVYIENMIYLSYIQFIVMFTHLIVSCFLVTITKTLIGEPIQTRNVTDCCADNGRCGVPNPCHTR